MAASLFPSPLWSGLYGDKDLLALFSDTAEIRAMLMVEGALATAQGELGLIPKDAAAAIQRAALDVVIDPAALAVGTGQTAVPVPALVAAFRAAMGDAQAASFVHWGATSQDIQDTGLVLRLRRVLDILDKRIARRIATLADLAAAHRTTVMAARTRGQLATPTTLGARIASWGMPLIRHRARLTQLRPRLLVTSLAGASGTRAAMGMQGLAVEEVMARGLDLGVPDGPWHSTRDTIVELGGWAALVTGSLGKMGADLMQLGQGEVAEVNAGAAGGSSTMPHKRNPVSAELLVQLARAAPPALAGLHGAMLHEGERDGVAWAQEWLHLPPLLLGAGQALATSERLLGDVNVDQTAMMQTVTSEQGALFAEAATFALAAHIPRPEAQDLVARACKQARATGTHLRDILADVSPAAVDWGTVFDPLSQAGDAPPIADTFVKAARA